MTRGSARRAVLAGAAALAVLPVPPLPAAAPRRLDFSDLAGWNDADHEPALAVFRAALPRARDGGPVRREDWGALAAALAAEAARPARLVFETHFAPALLAPEAHLTGYYEPEIEGARAPDARRRWPIRRPPSDPALLRHSRAEIAAGALDGRGLELFWLADRVEAFFLHIQGSGRIRLPDGAIARVGFAGRNAHPYRSISAALKRRGEARAAGSAGGLRRWLRANPDRAQEIFDENPSYIFFEERRGLRPEQGPIGAAGAALTPLVSAAIDPSHHPLGAPLWVEAPVEGFAGRLMVAEDVGAAIKGPGRIDLFFGSGPEAGRRAGRVNARGRLVTLLPRAAADRLGA